MNCWVKRKNLEGNEKEVKNGWIWLETTGQGQNMLSVPNIHCGGKQYSRQEEMRNRDLRMRFYVELQILEFWMKL